MNKTEAHSLLNAASAGANVPEFRIVEALMLTGDLDPIKRTDNVPQVVTHRVPKFSEVFA